MFLFGFAGAKRRSGEISIFFFFFFLIFDICQLRSCYIPPSKTPRKSWCQLYFFLTDFAVLGLVFILKQKFEAQPYFPVLLIAKILLWSSIGKMISSLYHARYGLAVI